MQLQVSGAARVVEAFFQCLSVLFSVSLVTEFFLCGCCAW